MSFWFTGNYAPFRAGLFRTAENGPGPKSASASGFGPSLGWCGTLEVRLATTAREIRKAQRLRYKVFFEEGGAQPDRTASLIRRDVCEFDRICDHLIVIDHAARSKLGRLKPRVVGTYRLLRQDVAQANSGFYSAGEFDIAPMLAAHDGLNFLELGRSCVAKNWRGKRTLELLWRGLWAYVRHHRVDVMFGCASLPGTSPLALAAPLGFLQAHARAEGEWEVSGWPGRCLPAGMVSAPAINPRKALAALPPLIKAYLRCGAKFSTSAVIDWHFGTIDVLAIMPVADISEKYIAHFGGEAGERAAA